jgi:hypothetical protein
MSMKKIILTHLFLLFILSSQCQTLTNFLPANEFSKKLEKIVIDFSNNFHMITIDSTVSHQGEFDSYDASVILPNAITSSVLRFHSTYDTSSSYQALFYNGDNHQQAIKIYKNCIRQIRNSKIHWVDRRLINFKGKSAEMDPNVSFAVCDLRVDLDDPRYDRFCAEVSLQNNTIENWQVQVNVFSKSYDTDGPEE